MIFRERSCFGASCSLIIFFRRTFLLGCMSSCLVAIFYKMMKIGSEFRKTLRIEWSKVDTSQGSLSVLRGL